MAFRLPDAIQSLRESRLILPGVRSTATPAAQLLIEAEATRNKELFRWSPRDCVRERERLNAAAGFRVGQHAFVGCLKKRKKRKKGRQTGGKELVWQLEARRSGYEILHRQDRTPHAINKIDHLVLKM